MTVLAKNEVADYMTVAMSRLIEDGDRAFHGVASPIPVVAILLAKKSHAPNATYLSITSGVNSTPHSLSSLTTADVDLTEGSLTSFNLTDIFDLSARGGLDVAFLSGVQIDEEGRLNLSAIGSFENPKVRLPGGAGSAQLLPTVKRAILWKTKHDTRGFVQNLDFITAAGNVDAVITPLGVFRKEEGKLRVWTVFPYSSFEEIQEKTGFPVEKHSQFNPFPVITSEIELLLNEIDPNQVRASEF